MARRVIFACALALALGCGAGAASAQSPPAAQSPPTAPATPDGLAAARQLITAMRATDQFKQLLPNIMQALKPALVQGRPEVERDFDAMMPVLIDGMSSRVNELVEQIADIYARNFTVDEMHQLTAFYATPVGLKLLDKTPVISRESLTLGQAFGQKVATELQGRIVEELGKKGYAVPPR